ncbi:chemotaxis protein CheW [Duganella sp. sic0402]|uniref:chemotaxis protein CheW n=1 Tax=Duganella sp. sic0402 TaxID=2854786 RepID=UPI0035A33CA9
MYPKDAELIASHERREARRIQRQVYISFTLENSYAVEIRQVREIIDVSAGEITRPPGLPAFMLGMLNLRQQMISVIDLRGLYRMPPLEDSSQSKILVVVRDGECYGLMVDAVENIMTVEDSKRYGAPKMMRNQNAQGDPRSEMDEVIDIGEGETRKTLSVFQCDRLLERLAGEMPALAA